MVAVTLQWTTDDVANWLIEASRTAHRLPPVRVQGYFNCWPTIVRSEYERMASDDAPSRIILAAGFGGYAQIHILESEGIYLPPADRTPDEIERRFAEISDRSTLHEYLDGSGEFMKFLRKSAADAGVTLG